MPELDYNALALSEGELPPMAVRQFERATATNALVALSPVTRELIFRVYANISQLNYQLQAMSVMDRTGGAGGPLASARLLVGKLRGELHGPVKHAKEALDAALGRGDEAQDPTLSTG